MSDLTHFDLLPLQMDPQSKAISSHNPSRALNAELEALNTLHRSLLNLETPSGAPPPPIPVNPKRTANVTKLHGFDEAHVGAGGARAGGGQRLAGEPGAGAHGAAELGRGSG
ncbi:hypothetical protein NM208_g17162 [Fusarium decemcellulare]|uniref:Uncharacterized protein n=1 Tax=Fusarium decemcellulare TaxID=57161 RepID=A0ACC1RA09_9HYPO|nr:hypothetical protein NM208_g17162 [Fusarium decemcellulare]